MNEMGTVQFITRIYLLLALALMKAASVCACSCSGYIDEFCHAADSSDHIALVELLEFEDASAALFRVIDNINKVVPDTISVLGQDGLNCNLSLYQFEAGDTLILNLDYDQLGYTNAMNGNIYHWSVFDCYRHFLHYSNGVVSGAINHENNSMTYSDFVGGMENCFDYVVGINDPNLNNVNVFPNPAENFVVIEIPSEIVRVFLVDINGREIQSKWNRVHSGFKLDMSELADGTYILSIEVLNGILRRKIIKLRQ